MSSAGWTFPEDPFGNFALDSEGDVPVYWSHSTDPTLTVTCTGGAGDGDCESGLFPLSLHVPAGAEAEAGSDGHLAVVDQADGYEYDFWQAPPDWSNDTMTVSSGCRLAIGANSGSGLGGCARAVPIGLLGGLIRGPEIVVGRIDHALVVSVPCTQNSADSTPYVWPANVADGSACPASDTDAPPLGALLQLTMTPAQIAASGAPPWQQAIMLAMHNYGMYIVDTQGSGDTTLGFGEEDDLSFTSQGYEGTLGQGELASAVEWTGGQYYGGDNWEVGGVPLPISTSDLQVICAAGSPTEPGCS